MLPRLRRRLGSGLSPTRFDLLWIAAAFAFTRVVVLGAMALAYSHSARPEPNLESDFSTHVFSGDLPPKWLEPFAHYDAFHYVGLVRRGYPPPGEWNGANAAFFPLYPLMVRAVDAVIGETFTSAMLVANLAALGAAFAIYGMARNTGRRRAGRTAAMLLLTSPAAHFLSLPYSESTFCLFVALGLWAVDRDRPVWAALAGALASASRVTGAIVAVALFLKALRGRWEPRRLASLGTASAFSCLGLVAYTAFCWQRYGDPFRFVAVQAMWGRHASLLGPIQALLGFAFDPEYYLMTLGALALAFWMVRRRAPITWTVPAWILILVPLSTGTLKSMVRFQGTNVPLLAGGSLLLRRRAVAWVLACGFVLQVYEAIRFALVYPNY